MSANQRDKFVMKKDLLKEHAALLRFEEKLGELTECVLDGEKVAVATDEKFGTTEATEAFAEFKEVLVNMYEVAGRAHKTLTSRAQDEAARIIETASGPKELPRVRELQASLS